MNDEVRRLREEQKKMKDQLEGIHYIFFELSKFLNNHEKKFKKKESILALKRIRDFCENKRKETEQIEKEYRRVRVILCSMCSHEVIVKDSLGNSICPICKDNFVRDYPNTTKYVINILTYDDRKINSIIDSMINEVIESNEEFVEYLEEKLEDFDDDNVKVLRRNVK